MSNIPKISKNDIKLPDGLNELMMDISREVLRSQPAESEIHTFIANYLDALLVTREQAIVAQRTIEDILQTSLQIREFLQKIGLTEEQAKKSADVISEDFRKFVFKKDSQKFSDQKIDSNVFEENVLLEKLIKQCNLTKNQTLKARDIIRVAFKEFCKNNNEIMKATYKNEGGKVYLRFWVDETMRGFVKTVPTEDELNYAAARIQAATRGFLARKTYKIIKQTKEKELADCLSKYEMEKTTFDETLAENSNKSCDHKYHNVQFSGLTPYDKQLQHVAANVIQKAYKGHRQRKLAKLTEEKKSLEEEKKSEENRTSSSIAQSLKVLNMRDETIETGSGDEKAALAIQSAYRGYKVRKELKSANEAAKMIQSKFRNYLSKKVERNQNISYTNSDELRKTEKAAIKIQAAVRGHLLRKNLKRASFK